MESIYRLLKKRFPEYPCTATSDRVIMSINEPIEIRKSYAQYYIRGCGLLGKRKLIKKIEKLIKQYHCLQALILELQPLFSFFGIIGRISGSYDVEISCYVFNEIYSIKYIEDKLIICINPIFLVREEISFETENCYQDLKALMIDEIKTKHLKKCLSQEHIMISNHRDGTLFDVVCRIVNLQTTYLILKPEF